MLPCQCGSVSLVELGYIKEVQPSNNIDTFGAASNNTDVAK